MATDPFDNIPNIRLEDDDVESFKRTRAQATSKPTKNSDEAQTKPTQSGVKGPSWPVFLLLIAGMAGAGGYWATEQQKIQIQSQNRILELENRLSATGEEMDQSTVALGVQVKELSAKTAELWEQMDKLWASAWRRNQADIKTVKASIETLANSNKKSLQSLQSQTASSDTEIGLLKEQLVNQASIVKQAQSQLAELSSGDADVEQQIASLREKLISTALANNTLTNRIDDLETKLKKATSNPATPSPTTPNNLP
jgi:uncharacterized protein HemX